MTWETGNSSRTRISGTRDIQDSRIWYKDSRQDVGRTWAAGWERR